MIGKSWRILYAKTRLAIELVREAVACDLLLNVCMTGIDPLQSIDLAQS